ncbi:DUF1763-domain-containing protein [Massarina eburnea CBS 473.64]|uniref:DUF1763-domain-containing protein n=1 Tax=Massarina eburnea CBS 473.64 TaxID=1395130 RepID=A0A6A6SBK4_9PLEO|nr:DUF1763-domain-containing protein [Massarina eburnea CBS 473.64]
MAKQEIIHAYRHVYRHSLRAIQFSKPARFTLRDRIRLAFRKPATTYNAEKVANTLEFLQYATAQNGLEHKIVKNLLLIWWSQERGGKGKPHTKALTQEETRIRTTAFDAFNHNIRMLNESMQLCIPAMTLRDPA